MDISAATALAREALASFDLDDSSEIEFIKYRENHVFRVTTPDGQSVALRLHRPGYRSDAEILTELQYVGDLRAQGLTVPEIVPAADGTLLQSVTWGDDERRVSVQRWIDGAVPSGDVESAFAGTEQPTREFFEEIGALIAQLHVAVIAVGTPEYFVRSPWDAAGLAGPTPLWGDPRVLRSLTPTEREDIDAAMSRLHRQLVAAPTHASIFGVVHADATPENVLVSDAGLTLIDFDDFGTGWFVFDAVSPLFFYTSNPRYPEFESALQRGYESVRPFEPVEKDLWQSLMLARALTYLGWAADRPGDPASDFIEATIAPWVASAARAYAAGLPFSWSA